METKVHLNSRFEWQFATLLKGCNPTTMAVWPLWSCSCGVWKYCLSVGVHVHWLPHSHPSPAVRSMAIPLSGKKEKPKLVGYAWPHRYVAGAEPCCMQYYEYVNASTPCNCLSFHDPSLPPPIGRTVMTQVTKTSCSGGSLNMDWGQGFLLSP